MNGNILATVGTVLKYGVKLFTAPAKLEEKLGDIEKDVLEVRVDLKDHMRAESDKIDGVVKTVGELAVKVGTMDGKLDILVGRNRERHRDEG